MKKITFYDLFLMFALILNVGRTSVVGAIILILAGTLEMVDVLPKLIRLIKESKSDGKRAD